MVAGVAEVVREEGDEAGDGDEVVGGASELQRMVEIQMVELWEVERVREIYSHFMGVDPKCDIMEALLSHLTFVGSVGRIVDCASTLLGQCVHINSGGGNWEIEIAVFPNSKLERRCLSADLYRLFTVSA